MLVTWWLFLHFDLDFCLGQYDLDGVSIEYNMISDAYWHRLPDALSYIELNLYLSLTSYLLCAVSWLVQPIGDNSQTGVMSEVKVVVCL